MLRHYSLNDISVLAEAIQASQQEIYRWMDWAHPDYGKQEAQDFIERSLRRSAESTGYDFAVIDKAGELCGSTSLNDVDTTARCASMGYWVSTAQTGRGIATEAANAVRNYAFNELGICRLEIYAIEENIASRKVAEKIGGIFEGISLEKIQYMGNPVSAAIYSIDR